jgi:hypothetical protein
VVYDRRIDDRELNFEASGALMSASLVMRDRETDSWWSIMTSDAIGGPLDGTELVEMPRGEKARFGDWVERHPDTLVLSVDGAEHIENNPYDNYFASGETFRGLEVDDDRLPAKEPIFAMWIEGRPHAIAHRDIEGGQLIEHAEGARLLFWRSEDAPIYASSSAWLVSRELSEDDDAATLAARAQSGEGGFAPLGDGFDTYWYTWVAVNPDTRLLP